MKDRDKSKHQLIQELQHLRQEYEEIKSSMTQPDLISNLLSMIPGGVSYTTDLTCKEIRHSPVVARFLRIKDWDILSYSTDEIHQVKILRNGRMISDGEMPIQRAVWYGEEIIGDELEFIWNDGVRKFSLWTCSPLRDTKGSIIGAMATVEEITHQKWMEEELRKNSEELLRSSEERFYKAFHMAPVIMSITEFETGKFLDANRAFLDCTGYALEEVIGRLANEIIWEPGGRVKVLEVIREKGKIENLEISFQTKKGIKAIILSSLGIVEFNGTKCLLAASIDVTNTKKMEKELARLDRLNLVGEMSAGLAHELRNPMTTVRGFLQMLDNKETEPLKKDYFNIMIEELDRANSIISEFLSLAKNKMIKLETISLNTVLTSLQPLLFFEALKQEKCILIDQGKIPDILVDISEIRQLIMNLAFNGLEAMTSGGVLRIATYQEGEDTLLCLQDEGKGIAPEILEQLGRPFVTTKENGTGLGLAICYSIASRHNAKIEIDTYAKGTTFFVRFSRLEPSSM